MIHEALLVLHSKTLVIRRRDVKRKQLLTELFVHLLESFGYVYQIGGKELDLHDLPAGSGKINVGTEARPVWRVVRLTQDGEQYQRPSGIAFRLGAELASELAGEQGTLSFTLFTRKVFSLLKDYMRTAAAIRLILLVLRQTDSQFVRRLRSLLDDLGFDVTHPNRAIEQVAEILRSLMHEKLIDAFDINVDTDRLTVQVNRDWYLADEVQPGR